MKNYKKISSAKLLLALDRLTRFKPTFEKYERVFCDIVNLHSDIQAKSLSAKELAKVTQDIFNYTLGENEDDFLNNLLREDEQRMFHQDEDSEALLGVDINFKKAFEILGENLPNNLKRLALYEKNKELAPKDLRQKLSLGYPIEKVVLSEGITEEILLEELAKKQGYDFKKEGVYLLGAGGKNQVARKFYRMMNEIKLPIFVLLDADATEVEEMILPKLRTLDALYIIKSGEFEDILPKSLVIKALNTHFKNNLQCSPKDFDTEFSMSRNLKEIFRVKGFGDFKKSEFAKILKDYCQKTNQNEPSTELLHITKLIKVL